MTQPIGDIPEGKKIYFASDFHLGAPNHDASLVREKKIVRWLNSIKSDAHAVFLMGDIFDFWFEHKWTIPKGFVRFQGKIAEFVDEGIPVLFFTGNHDMWMFDYFPKELGTPVFKKSQQYTFNGKKLYIGHGDGLGPGDYSYKLLKKIFTNRVCQWLFARIHPNLSMSIANAWSKKSRVSSSKEEEKFLGDKEFLLAYAREVEQKEHYDYYVFGHRHLPLDLEVNKVSRYINLGEWVNDYTYAEFDGTALTLKHFEKK